MALPIWIPDALRSEQKNFEKICWRCVEAQHIVSTLQLVDTLDEQYLLEDILEETKPSVPAECIGLHYLYMTPFRYGVYPNGSRFRKAGPTPGVCYVSEEPSTAIIETAFHLILFFVDSPDTPFPSQPSEHTVFDVPVKTSLAIDLTAKPFSDASDLWINPTDYGTCQILEEMARTEGIQIILYNSVRTPEQKTNVAILNCDAFAESAPKSFQTWRLWFNRTGVYAICGFQDEEVYISPEIWKTDSRLENFDWERSH